MNGASLSLLRLTPSLLALLDEPCGASAWTRSCDLLQPPPTPLVARCCLP